MARTPAILKAAVSLHESLSSIDVDTPRAGAEQHVSLAGQVSDHATRRDHVYTLEC